MHFHTRRTGSRFITIIPIDPFVNQRKQNFPGSWRAAPADLIVNKLLTSSIKYAWPEGFDCKKQRKEAPSVSVRIVESDGRYTMTFRDNGIGLPADVDLAVTKMLGLILVHFLAHHQLQAETCVQRIAGTEFIFRLRERQ